MKPKVIMITGASSGIGKATALSLLQQGHIVYGAARRVEKMKELVEAGGHALPMDITIDTDIQDVVSKVIEKEQRIDVLINNAGYGLYGAVEDIPIEDARKQFEVNLFGLARITQLCLPYMRKQKAGRIINISSIGGKIYSPLGAWYYATKHALEGWSDSLRLDVTPFHIDVVLIEPGVIQTDFGNVMSEPLLKYSGNSAYHEMAKAVAIASEESFTKKNGGSPVKVIVDEIIKAVHDRKPKTRYTAGKYSTLLPFLRKYLGDRIFDKMVLFQLDKIVSKNKS
ncbi:oxidoreductase [Aquimarina sp. ERC-38]|uniref:oxidoreductase n=1 Tax=Aquimarina sp. ERC-38 TaxID=2949996 RepID=UPI00224854C8|nr:oxidoreductase [Aquimarina sp. ERC-38]UZO82559.1 oxidoreductase [Aquimarina sp. ERC-38]